MLEIKYSFELLKDTNSLLGEIRCFMSFNLIHADSYCSSSKGKTKINELIKFSLDNAKKMDLFKAPLRNYEKENKEILIKNLVNLLKFISDYLNYANPIVETYLKSSHSNRLKEVRTKYLEYHQKYFPKA